MKPWANAAVQGAACGLVIGFVLLIGGRLWRPEVAVAQAKPAAVPDVVKARRFEVVDAAGEVRAVLDVTKDISGLALFGAAGKGSVGLAVAPDGSSGLALRDAARKRRLSLAVDPDGTPSMGLSDAAGMFQVSLSADPNGSIGLALAAAPRKPMGFLGVLPNKKGLGLGLLDEAGKLRMWLAVYPDGAPHLILMDTAGSVIWQAP